MFKKKPLFLTTILMVLNVLTMTLPAQSSYEISFPITSFQLNNGLQVILSEDYSLPIISIIIAYKVGSYHDPAGKTGLAYLMENLMFMGSRNVRRMQHYSAIRRIGGRLGARTELDKTLFYQTVSSNQLATVLWLEADRMKSLAVTSANIEQAKSEIINELNQRKTSDPFWDASILFDQMLYPDHSHAHSIIEQESDLRDIRAADVFAFHSTYYKPNNAVICIVGNINKVKTIEQIRKYFQTIPSGNKIPAEPLPQAEEFTAKTDIITNPLVSTPGFYLGFPGPRPFSREYYPMLLIDYLLLNGKSSRLIKRLLKKDRIVFQIQGGFEKRKSFCTFKIFVTNSNKYTRERSQKTIISEINKIKTSHISTKELDRIKSMYTKDHINRYSDSLRRGIYLTEAFVNGLKLEDLQTELDKIMEVTAERITWAVNKYFTQKRILLDIDIK